MDQRLFKAARLGDVVGLNTLLEEDPLILERVSLSPIAETPLHIAVLAGKTDFAKEMIRTMPSFAWELNQDGFSPMHMASARGNIEIVRELLTQIGPDLCLVKDKGGRTPLHYAAIKGRVRVIEQLLSHRPKAIEAVTARGETALHLAVKNNQFEALKFLVEMLEKLHNHYHGELINAKDDEGNTILELATSTKQHQVVQLLHGKLNLSRLVQVNAAADLESMIDMGNTECNPRPSQQPDQSKQNKSDVLNAILIAASLIATVTYQAGLSPPPTIWKEGKKLDTRCIFHPPKSSSSLILPTNRCPAYTFFLFMSFNTAGFLSSVILILITIFQMLCRQPPTFAANFVRYGLLVLPPTSLVSMVATYTTLVVTMSPNGLSTLIIYFIGCILLIAVIVCTVALRESIKLAKKFKAKRRMRLRRNSTVTLGGFIR